MKFPLRPQRPVGKCPFGPFVVNNRPKAKKLAFLIKALVSIQGAYMPSVTPSRVPVPNLDTEVVSLFLLPVLLCPLSAILLAAPQCVCE